MKSEKDGGDFVANMTLPEKSVQSENSGGEQALGIPAPKKSKFSLIPVSNSLIDKMENEKEYFARGLNFYKLFLVCFIGCFLGVAVELVWCLFKNGYIESRSGLVYGPFNMLYGVAAVMLTLVLYKFRNRSFLWSFFCGMAAATAFEYFCSWFQEVVFNSRSWDYIDMPFNLNGRVCLLYSVFWGVLSVWWIKDIYPRMCSLLLKLPQKYAKILTWALVIFLAFDCVITFAATYRREQRERGIPASNPVAVVLDERFPDERLDEIFSNSQQLPSVNK